MTSHIAKDSFDFKNRTKCGYNGTTLKTCNIKSLCTNNQHDPFYTAIEYWIKKLQNNLLLLQKWLF